MRFPLALALTLLAPAGAFAQLEHPPDDAAVAAALETVRLDRADVDAVPPGMRRRQGAGRTYHASPDWRRLYFPLDDGTFYRVRLDGPDLAPGTRLVPVVELSTVRFASMPDQSYALLIPGSDRIYVFGYERVGWSLPAESVGGGFESTEYVRAMRACPRRHERCAIVGRPARVAAAKDPLAPNHGWLLTYRSPPAAPEGPAIRRLERATSIPDVRLVIDRHEAPDGGHVDRVHLRVSHHAPQHAFDAVYSGSAIPFEPRYAAVALGARIYVHDHGGTVSIHERRRGRQIGRPLRVTVEPYYDICMAGGANFSITPVLDARRVGFAMVTLEGTVLRFERLGGDSVRHEIEMGELTGAPWLVSHLERRGDRIEARFFIPDGVDLTPP